MCVPYIYTTVLNQPGDSLITHFKVFANGFTSQSVCGVSLMGEKGWGWALSAALCGLVHLPSLPPFSFCTPLHSQTALPFILCPQVSTVPNVGSEHKQNFLSKDAS